MEINDFPSVCFHHCVDIWFVPQWHFPRHIAGRIKISEVTTEMDLKSVFHVCFEPLLIAANQYIGQHKIN